MGAAAGSACPHFAEPRSGDGRRRVRERDVPSAIAVGGGTQRSNPGISLTCLTYDISLSVSLFSPDLVFSAECRQPYLALALVFCLSLSHSLTLTPTTDTQSATLKPKTTFFSASSYLNETPHTRHTART